jgi:hypothetical protein
MCCKSQQTPRRPISPMSKLNVDASPISTPTQTHNASLSRATHSAAARRSWSPAPLRSHPALLPAGTAPSPHPRLIPALPPHPRALNRKFLLTLATAVPADVLDDGPLSRAVRLDSGWDLTSIYRPRDPLFVHGIKDRSWPSPVTGRLQVRRRARAPVHRRRLRGVSQRQVSLDADVSAASACPAPTPQFSRTSSIDSKV